MYTDKNGIEISLSLKAAKRYATIHQIDTLYYRFELTDQIAETARKINGIWYYNNSIWCEDQNCYLNFWAEKRGTLSC